MTLSSFIPNPNFLSRGLDEKKGLNVFIVLKLVAI